MKDKDFDDIGKRLYDMEAEPPKNGWNKIMGGVNQAPVSGKIIFLRKNWWKPLMLLITIGAYLLLPGTIENVSSVATGKNADTIAVPSKTETIKPFNEDASELNEKTNQNLTEALVSKNQIKTNQIIETKERNPSEKNKPIPDEKHNPDSFGNSDTKVTTALDPKNNNLGQIEMEEVLTEPVGPAKIQALVDETSPKDDTTPEPLNNKEEITTGSKNNENKTISTQSLETLVAAKATEAENKDLVPEENTSTRNSANGAKELPEEVNKNLLAPPAESTVLLSSPLIQTAAPGTHVKENVNGELKIVENTVKADSINTIETTKDTAALPLIDSKKDEDKKEAVSGLWRTTLALTPQYTTKTIQPIANDDVLMIDLKNKNGFYQEQIGLGIAVGFGRAITTDFYIDAQLTYHQVKQDVSYSFSTGEVDTLLALQQPDGSIRVSPVYDLHTSDITSKYSYGGVRISGTYYFWARPGRRFNITAGAGIDQLLSSSLEERIDGESIPKNGDDYLNNPNYSLVIGAGYNISFRRGWELMINPTMTYYLLKEKSEDSLFNFNQRSYGLNFMLSKTISFKK